MANIVGKLLVQIAADTAKLTAGLELTQRQMKAWEKNVNGAVKNATRAIGALGIAFGAVEIASFVKSSIDAADRLKDMSQSAGISAESLSAYSYAARQSGTDLEVFARGSTKASELLNDFANGGKEAAEKLSELGLSAINSQGDLKSAEEIIGDISDKFSKMPDGVRKTGMAVDIFGEKVGPKLIPLLNNGREGIEGLKAAAKEYGVVIERDAIEASDQFNDVLAHGADRARAMASELAPLALAIAKVATGFNGLRPEKIGGKELLDSASIIAEQTRDAYSAIQKGLDRRDQEDAERKRLKDLEEQAKLNEKLIIQNREWLESEKRLAAENERREFARQKKLDAQKEEMTAYDIRVQKTNEQREAIEEGIAAEREYQSAIIERMDALSQANRDYADSLGTFESATLEAGQNFSRTFASMLVNGRASWDGFLKGILTDLAAIATHNLITAPLYGALFGGAGQMMSGGLFSGGLLGGIFGGFFAEGGNPPLNKASIVGERGPEIIVPRGPATVMPMDKIGTSAGISIGHIDMRGASVEAVARLEVMLTRVNASVESRSVGAVVDDIRRGGPIAAALKGA